MGSFITNFHVRADGDAGGCARRLLERLRDSAGPDVEVAREDDEVDRVIAVAWRHGDHWVSVFDDSMAQDEKLVAKRVRECAGDKGAVVVAFWVHDSDHASATLFRSGRRVSRLANRGSTGDVAGWSWTLDEAGRRRLAEAWGGDATFADDYVTATAQALGIEEAFAVASSASEVSGVEGASYLELKLRDRNRAARFEAGAPSFAPPLLRAAAGWYAYRASQPTPLLVGVREQLQLQFQPTSGKGAGVKLSLAGSAISEGFVSIDEVAIVWRQPGFRDSPAAIDSGWRRHVEDTNGSSGEIVIEAKTVPIQPAARVAPNPWSRDLAEMMYPRHTMIHVHARVLPLRVGNGELIVTLAPIANPAGDDRMKLKLSISQPGWRPMRTAVDVLPRWVRALNETGHLWALLCGPFDDAGRDVVFRAISRWCAEGLAPHAKRMAATPDSDIAIDSAKFATVPGKRNAWWAAFPDWLRGHARLAASTTSDRESVTGGFDYRVRDNAELYGISRTDTEAPNSFALALIIETRYLTPLERDARQATLESIVDEAVASGAVAQAQTAEWGHSPLVHLSTIFEEVCAASPDWLHRVRAVTPTMWLGAEMRRSLADDAALRQVATLRDLPEGALRIDVLDGKTLSDLERALEPLLPDTLPPQERGP